MAPPVGILLIEATSFLACCVRNVRNSGTRLMYVTTMLSILDYSQMGD